MYLLNYEDKLSTSIPYFCVVHEKTDSWPLEIQTEFSDHQRKDFAPGPHHTALINVTFSKCEKKLHADL